MDKHTYVVAEGISAVNGKPVPKSREMRLTEREALFDFSLGRLTLKPNREAGTTRGAGRKGKADPELTGEEQGEA